MTVKENNERIAVLEKGLLVVEGDIKEIRGDVKAIHRRINDLIDNDLKHLRRDGRVFWGKVFGAGGAGAILIELFIRIIVPRLMGG